MTERKDESPFSNLTMAMLPATEHTVTLGDELVLADNFGLPADRAAMEQFIASAHPFKIGFTFILFCVSGRMRVRLNLRECPLGEGSVLVAVPGAIGECLAFSDDCRVGIIAFSGTRYFDGIAHVAHDGHIDQSEQRHGDVRHYRGQGNGQYLAVTLVQFHAAKLRVLGLLHIFFWRCVMS